jgi:DNA-directed RNA polymerase specialized sigma24 family protein
MAPDSTITQEAFTRLLDWLDPDPESAASKYESVRQRLIRLFVGRGCFEAEMLADLTIDRVARKVPELNGTYVGEPAAYFCGVAKNVYLEWLRKQKRSRVAPRDFHVTDEDDDREAEFACLEKCLATLPVNLREMIVEYYRDEKRAKIERRKALAEKLGITIGALQIKTSRVRARLHACVHECLTPRS